MRIFVTCLAGVLLASCANDPPVPLDKARLPNGLGTRAAAEAAAPAPALALGEGDSVTLQVYGRPELSVAATVDDGGTISLPLVGAVTVKGLSPAKAGARVAAAYRNGGYLVNPQVTLALANARGSQVSVLGAVRSPGRYALEPKSTVLDVLALAGGIGENGSDTIVLLRTDGSGKVARYGIDLKGLNQAKLPVPALTLRAGDSLFVPQADQFYVYGEVKSPNMYRLEPGMTVVQAISRGGGITPRGSNSRIEIRRRRPDGTWATSGADLEDLVQANDVVRVKERLF